MPDDSENPDGSSPSIPGQSISHDTEEARKDGGQSSERDLAAFDADFPEVIMADSRGELEGSTEDGKSPIYLEGRFRFVTPCHVSKVGLRASQICASCFGDLKQPVETAVMLSCGHWTTATFGQGERRHMCAVPGCEAWTLIKAERVAITRYDVRPLAVFEQGEFL
jgi:hypothetical protein